eukprot:COSAG01_NODE_2487_length_7592_cov_4.423328_14_plen_117_part_00
MVLGVGGGARSAAATTARAGGAGGAIAAIAQDASPALGRCLLVNTLQYCIALLHARGRNRVIVTIITASSRAFQRCIGLGGVDKVLTRLEGYYCAETAVWQPELPSRGPLLGRYAL